MSAAGYAENYADYAIDSDLEDYVDPGMTWGAVWQMVMDAYEAGWNKATEVIRERI